jgi:hypothetical protein
MEKDVSRLRRQIYLTESVSLLVVLFGLIAILLYFRPDLAGVTEDQVTLYKGRIIWICTGVFFVLFGSSAYLFVNHWKSRLLWVYQNMQPVPMSLQIEIEDSTDSTDYLAILTNDSSETDQSEKWRLNLWLGLSKAQYRLKEGIFACQVYFDPKLNLPLIIQTEDGLLWALGGSASVKRLI